MNDTRQHLEHLAEIRALMERSSRFISLSGLSGVWAGLCALIGAATVYLYLDVLPFSGDMAYYQKAIHANKWGLDYQTAFVLIGIITLVCALAGGLFFTSRKAHSKGLKMWDHTSQRLLYALMVPLFAGGVFCLGMLYWGLPGLIAPATLIFYGLGLFTGGKFTVRDVEYLGLSEIALGLAGLFLLGNGLELWTFGFGFLHIFYGWWMYNKYDRKQ